MFAEIFESFIKGEIIELIVNETNKYADNYVTASTRVSNPGLFSGCNLLNFCF